MALFITSLNSGSNGNCYYIGNGQEAVLIDAGISCSETEKRMKQLGLPLTTIKAIFVSHEHGDHIAGVSGLSKKYNIPVYITKETYKKSNLRLQEDLIFTFEAFKAISIGQLAVTAFPKQHDAADPHSFIVISNNIAVGVFTDIGLPCLHIINYFKQCNAAFLEANYDDGMLEKGNYPYHLKQRIRGGEGHLSNAQALQLFTAHRPSFMQHLLLSHLSKNNNSPQLVSNLFDLHAGNTNVVVASRYEASAVYEVYDKKVPVPFTKRSKKNQLQLSLF